MSLTPSARELVRAGAKAARPSDADRERVLEAMRSRLGDAAMLGAAGLVVTPSLTRALWLKVSAWTLGVGLLVGGAVVALQPASEPRVAAVARPPHLAENNVVAPTLAAEPTQPSIDPAQPSPSEPAPAAAPAPSARRSNDRLAQEVSLLSRATSALRSGRAGDALKALNEHQSQFPKGALAEERRAAKAQALCALGRYGEAETELARLSPQSPQAARARQVCAAKR